MAGAILVEKNDYDKRQFPAYEVAMSGLVFFLWNNLRL